MNLFKKKKKAVMRCWCHTCNLHVRDDMGLPYALTRMILCPDCVNKRCPRANYHNNVCTKSNEPGQIGSYYE